LHIEGTQFLRFARYGERQQGQKAKERRLHREVNIRELPFFANYCGGSKGFFSPSFTTETHRHWKSCRKRGITPSGRAYDPPSSTLERRKLMVSVVGSPTRRGRLRHPRSCRRISSLGGMRVASEQRFRGLPGALK
jgi:hypothetical protein